MKKVLFVDRDGTLIEEPENDFQVDSFDKLKFKKKVITALSKLSELGFEKVIVSNQDGLGTDSFPYEDFIKIEKMMIEVFRSEGVEFDETFFDNSFENDNSNNRKPKTGMLTKYINNPEYDLANSWVIGDRLTDIELAANLGAKAIFYSDNIQQIDLLQKASFAKCCKFISSDWDKISEYIRLGERRVSLQRKTNETDISITLDLDGSFENSISTGLNFFNHMLDQIVNHSQISMKLCTKGDTEVDEHHTIEDTAIVLGTAIRTALGEKLGINRYGFSLPMDECDASVLLDFGGRIDFSFQAEFKREYIGDVPTEMFKHFFKTLCENLYCNMHIKATGENEHHKIEAIFKAFTHALQMAIERKGDKLFSSKGIL